MVKRIRQLLMLAIMLSCLIYPVGVQAAENKVVINTKYTLTPMEPDYAELLLMEESGTITLNLSAKDTGTKKGSVGFAIISYEYLFDTDALDRAKFVIDDLTSSKPVVNEQIHLEKGLYIMGGSLTDYIVTYPNGVATGSGEKVELTLKIEGNGKHVDFDGNEIPSTEVTKDPSKTTSTPEESKDVSELDVEYADKLEDIKKIDATSKQYSIYFEGGYTEFTIPVNIDKVGALYLMLGERDTNYYSFTATLYSDANLKNKVGYSAYLYSGDGSTSKFINIPKTGKYYLNFQLSRKYGDTEKRTFPVKLVLLLGGTRTIKSGTEYIAYQDYDTGDILYKITTSKAGYIELRMQPDNEERLGYAYTTLLNSEKKVISEENYESATYSEDGVMKHYYSVGKGTYYIKVKSSMGVYGIGYKFTAVTDKSGSSKSKATELKLGGSAVKGLVQATDKTSKVDWFKFTLTKSKSVKITIPFKVDGQIKVEVCDSKGNTLIGGIKILYNEENTLTFTSDKLEKGTYYIKVYKVKAESSGYYTVKVK